MSTTFSQIPVPGTGEYGAAVDVTTYARDKTLVAQGPQGSHIIVEGSLDGGVTFAPLTSIEPLPNPSNKELPYVLTHIRARNIGALGVVSLAVSAVVASGTEITLPAIDGVAVDTSAFGESKTILITGTYTGSIVIYGSEDGTTFVPVLTLFTRASDARSIEGIYQSMKAGVVGGSASSVVVGIGASDDQSSGGGSNGLPIVIPMAPLDWGLPDENASPPEALVVFEQDVPFGGVQVANLVCAIAGIAKIFAFDAPGLMRVFVYVGATAPGSVAGGTQIYDSGDLAPFDVEQRFGGLSSSFPTPAGNALVQIAAINAAGGGEGPGFAVPSAIRGVTLVFSEG